MGINTKRWIHSCSWTSTLKFEKCAKFFLKNNPVFKFPFCVLVLELTVYRRYGSCTNERLVKGDQDHVSRNINWSFHNSREIYSAFHVSRKQNDIWKLRPSTALLYILIIRPLLALREQEHEEECMSCHGHAILLLTVENNRRDNQSHGSRRI